MSIIFKTYLTPSIPQKICELIAKYIEKKCKIKVNLQIELTSSGVKKGMKMEEDLGWMCTPPFIWLYENYKDEIELVPMAPVFKDKRNNDEPVYFSDILVRKDSNINSLEDLNNHIWAYNDTESLSGYFCIKGYLKKNKINIKLKHSGGHYQSMDMIKSGETDISAIDSNALLFKNPYLKNIGFFGPHPIQPFIIKKNCIYKKDIIKAFKEINENSIMKTLKNEYFIKNFKEVNENFYFQKYSINHLIS